MQTLLTITNITTNGITVTVKIDFKNKTVSLVDNCFEYPNKNWIFVERGLEYQKGWHGILEAMKVAIDYGFEQLKIQEEKKQEELIEIIDKTKLILDK